MRTAAGFPAAAAQVGEGLRRKPLLRAINFHNTARQNVDEFERQLAHCARHFSTLDEDDLDRYLATGRWHKPRPGLLLAFYEGYRNNYDVIRAGIGALLQEHVGITRESFVCVPAIRVCGKRRIVGQVFAGEDHRYPAFRVVEGAQGIDIVDQPLPIVRRRFRQRTGTTDERRADDEQAVADSVDELSSIDHGRNT